MTLLIHASLYVACLFLVMVVYTAQKQTTAAGTMSAAVRATTKLTLWSVGAVGVMFGLEYLFVD